MLKVTVSEVFSCDLDSLTVDFLDVFPRMMNWWFERSREFSGNVFSDFRNKFYNVWRKEWRGYNSQHAQASCLIAFSNIKLQKKRNQKVDALDFPLKFALISPRITKIVNGHLVYPIKTGVFAKVNLNAKTSRQEVLLGQAENDEWRVGQSFITSDFCVVPFTRYLDLISSDPVINQLV